VGALFLLVSVAAIATTRASGGAALLWPSNALAASLLIRMPQVRWSAAYLSVLLAGLLANHFAGGDSWGLSLGFTLVNLFEINLMVATFRFLIRFPYPQITIVQASVMTLFMGLFATGIAAVLGAMLLHEATGAPVLSAAREWWMSDAIGACLFAPPVILYSKQALQRLLRPRFVALNAAALLACVTATWLSVAFIRFPFVLIALAPMVAAFQVGSFGASILSLCNGLTVAILWKLGIQPLGLDPTTHGTSLVGLPFVALIAALMPPIAVGLGTDSRRRMVKALTASERRFRESMEHSPLGMITLDLKGHWAFTNAALQKLLGYSAAELAAMDIESLAHPSELPRIWEHWGRLISSQIDSYATTRRFRHRDGSWVWTHCAVSMARDADGMPMHIIKQVESLQERHRAEGRLAAERELLRTTLAAISDAVITTDPSGAVTYMNDAAVALIGKAFESIEGRDMAQVLGLTDVETQAPVENLVQRCIRERRAIKRRDACALLRPDGLVCYLADSVTPVFDEQFEITGLVVLLHDVTEHRERTLALHHRANHDALTDLLNRGAFERRVDKAFNQASGLQAPAALIAIDLDRFKAINDTCGHAAGDQMLQMVAEALRRVVRPADAIGRLGGDEFAVLLNDCESARAREIAQRVLVALNTLHMNWNGVLHSAGASVGVATCGASFDTPKDWIAAADEACYAAKQNGRGRLCTWSAARRDAVAG